MFSVATPMKLVRILQQNKTKRAMLLSEGIKENGTSGSRSVRTSPSIFISKCQPYEALAHPLFHKHIQLPHMFHVKRY